MPRTTGNKPRLLQRAIVALTRPATRRRREAELDGWLDELESESRPRPDLLQSLGGRVD